MVECVSRVVDLCVNFYFLSVLGIFGDEDVDQFRVMLCICVAIASLWIIY